MNKHPLCHCEDCTLQDALYVPSEVPRGWTKKYLLVGQQPGREELRKGRPFVGPSGALLRAALAQAEFSPADVAFTNAILCGTPSQREPTPPEVACCAPRLMAEVGAASHVLSLGNWAARALGAPPAFSVFKERGRYWWLDEGVAVLPTLHPAFVLRKPEAARDFFDDIEKLRKEPYDATQTRYDIASPADLLGWITRIHYEGRGTVVSIDLECDNRPWPGRSRYLVSPHRDRILCGSLSWRNGYALVVPGDLFLAFREEWLRLFADPNLLWTGHNVKFDFKMLQTWLGGRPRYPHFYDTLLAHYVIDERKGTHALKPRLVGYYFDKEDWEPGLIQKHLRARTQTFGDVPLADLYQYSALDGDYERRLYFPLKAAVERAHQEGLLEFLLEVTDAMMDLELHGVPIDIARVDRVETAHQREADEAEAQLQAHAAEHGWRGKSLNVRSPQQLARYLYDVLGYTPPIGRTIKAKSGRSTNAESLEKLAAQHPDNPFFGTLREYRRHKKFVGTYCANLRILSGEGPDPASPTFYPDYMLVGTETGRLSGSVGMTWPEAADRDMPVGERVRTCFIAPEGKVWVKVDYSQAELRLFGWYAKDPFLRGVYVEGKDLHNEVSLALFGKSRSELGPKYSRAVKAFNFGFLYRIKGGEEEFVEGMLLDRAAAKALVAKYEQELASGVAWKKAQIRTMLEAQEVCTPTGRKRRFALITDAIVDEAKKASINAPVQSLSSDLILASLHPVRELLRAHPEWEAAMVLLLHDELDFLVLPEHVEALKVAVRPIMELEVPTRFGIRPEDMPLKVDFSTGPSWGEAEQ